MPRHEKDLKIKLLSGVLEPYIKKLKKKYEKYQLILEYLNSVEENIFEPE